MHHRGRGAVQGAIRGTYRAARPSRPCRTVRGWWRERRDQGGGGGPGVNGVQFAHVRAYRKQYRHAISLIGPGPGFSPEYAMTTDPGEPVILATLTGPGGESAGLLLTDGCHRLYKAAVTGRAEIPAVA